MKVRYVCEICGASYNQEDYAKNCEKRGMGVEYPIGTIFGNHSLDAFYTGITFAVAKNDTNSHLNYLGLWACRDNGAGDSLGKELCSGGGSLLGLGEGKVNQNHPTFIRMVKYLKSQNIPIHIWDGEKAVPYEA